MVVSSCGVNSHVLIDPGDTYAFVASAITTACDTMPQLLLQMTVVTGNASLAICGSVCDAQRWHLHAINPTV